MKKMSRINHITYGLDDATPETIDEATQRRKRMWARLEAKVTLMTLSVMIVAGIVVARFIIDVMS